jgi:hypothetical protein
MPQKEQLQILNFEGISVSQRIPNINSCQDSLNFDVRSVSGDLRTIKNDTLEIHAPTNISRNKLTNIAYNHYTVFSVDSRDVHVLIGSATLNPETPYTLSPPSPIIVPVVLVYPYYNPNTNTWVNGWRNLAECYLTRIRQSSTNEFIYLDTNDAFFATDEIKTWVLQNISSASIAPQFIVDGFSVSGSVLYSAGKSTQNIGDTVLIQRSYIPFENLVENAKADKNDITTHAVLDSLRIGFGSKNKRKSLAINFVNDFLDVYNFDLYTYTQTQLERRARRRGLYLNVYNFPASGKLGLNVFSSGGQLATGSYNVSLFGVLDGFQPVHISDASFYAQTPTTMVDFYPTLTLSTINPRLTDLYVFMTKPNQSVFYLNATYNIRSLTYNTGSVFKVNDKGEFVPRFSMEPGQNGIEYNTLNNAAVPSFLIANEANAITGFKSSLQNYLPVISQNVTVQNGLYALKSPIDVMFTNNILWRSGKWFTVNCYVKIVSNTYPTNNTITVLTFHSPSHDSKQVFSTSYANADDWVNINFSFQATHDFDAVVIQHRGIGGTNEELYVDNFSFSEVNQPSVLEVNQSSELISFLGYNPFNPLVDSWEKGLIINGRTYALNTRIQDEVLKNKIILSPASSGAGAFLYDVLSVENFIDAETFDGNDTITIHPTPTNDIFLFRRNSIDLVNINTGVSYNIRTGDGVISKHSVSSIDDTVFFTGFYDVYAIQNGNIINISENSIRKQYRELPLDIKKRIIAITEPNTKSYRFSYDNTSFLFTNKGWFREDLIQYPIMFSRNSSGSLLYTISNGSIYSMRTSDTFKSTFLWRSIIIDSRLMNIPYNSLFKVISHNVHYNANTQFLINFYNSDISTVSPVKSWILPSGSGDYTVRHGLDNTLRRYFIEIKNVSGSVASSDISIHKIATRYSYIPTGLRNNIPLKGFETPIEE